MVEQVPNILTLDACQGDPISAYFFKLTSEILFFLIEKYLQINGIEIFEFSFLYIAYVDDAYFLKIHTPMHI